MPYPNSALQPVVQVSRLGFSDTVARLGVEISRAGASIFCKLDQSAAAKVAGLTLRPTTLMDAVPLAALHLPLNLLVWEERSIAYVAYVPVRHIAEHFALDAERALIEAVDERTEALIGLMSDDKSA
jgi:uncharacterized protein (DUF302 family)